MKGIVHVASTNRRGKSSPEAVRRSLVSALELATTKRYNSLGVAAIGSGPWEIDLPDWYRSFAEVAIDYFSGRPREESKGPPPLDVILALFETPDFAAEVEAVREAVLSAWQEAGEPVDGAPEWRPPGMRKRLGEQVRKLGSGDVAGA